MRFPSLAIIGGGNMARSLVGGLLAQGAAPTRIVVSDPLPDKLAYLRERFGIAISGDNEQALRSAEVAILALKPQTMRAALESLQPQIDVTRPLLISIAAGIPIAAMSRWLNGYRRITRTMPNRPALIGCGVSALYAPPGVAAEDRATTELILGALGTSVWVEREELIDSSTAVSGSGPAYFFLLMEALEQAAVEQGIEPAAARHLVIETAYGAARMARQREDEPRELREQVTSPQGTTAAALAVLEQADVRGIVSRAVAAAAQRAGELARQFGQ